MVVEIWYLRRIPKKLVPVIDLMRPGISEGEERLTDGVPVAHLLREACQEAVITCVGRAGRCHDRTKGVWNLKSRLSIENPCSRALDYRVLIDLRRQFMRRASYIGQLCRPSPFRVVAAGRDYTDRYRAFGCADQ